MSTRRNILSMMGLAPAAAAATVAAEQFDGLGEDSPAGFVGVKALATKDGLRKYEVDSLHGKAITVLENLAANLRSCNLLASADITITSTIKHDDWMQHQVTFTFEVPGEEWLKRSG